MTVKFGATNFELPIPFLEMRGRNQQVFQKLTERGVTPIPAIIAANRLTSDSRESVNALLQPSLGDMDVWQLKDIDKAVDRIIQAKRKKEKIGLVTDFDVDGISSACVMKLALTRFLGFPESDVTIFVNNRMVFGYGFNERALDNIINKSGENIPSLLITADQGSNDSATILKYKSYMASIGVNFADVIVTDHHHINQGEVCEGAVAFVNPQRLDDDFTDKTVCGCVVALLVMSAVRESMIAKGVIPPETPKLSSSLLTYASLATVADCVSLKSKYNRYIVKKGIEDINNGIIPAWKVLKSKLNKPGTLVDAKDLAFMLGPIINADSRTGGDGSEAINFLLAETVDDADFFYEKLTSRNNKRKEIDLSMQELALAEASNLYFNDGIRGLVIYLPQGNHGIHGIVASRVKERFNCPVLIFSPVNIDEEDHDDKIITASGRCIEKLNIRDMAFSAIGDHWKLGGGHPAAMGIKIKMKDLEEFKDNFDKIVKSSTIETFGSLDILYPRILIDHVIQTEELDWINSLDSLVEINKLGPYGQRFEAPIFAINATIVEIKPLGNSGNHIKVLFRDARNKLLNGKVWNYKRQPWWQQLAVGEQMTFAISISYDAFFNNVGILIEAAVTGFNAVSVPR